MTLLRIAPKTRTSSGSLLLRHRAPRRRLIRLKEEVKLRLTPASFVSEADAPLVKLLREPKLLHQRSSAEQPRAAST